MKAPVDKAATQRVLADIAAAVRPVESARTAAAVERVLRTASPGVYEGSWGLFGVTVPLFREMGFDLGERRLGCSGPCDACDEDDRDDLPGLTYFLDRSLVPNRQRKAYALHVVSPHLFAEVER